MAVVKSRELKAEMENFNCVSQLQIFRTKSVQNVTDKLDVSSLCSLCKEKVESFAQNVSSHTLTSRISV